MYSVVLSVLRKITISLWHYMLKRTEFGYVWFLQSIDKRKKQEAFRERGYLHVCDILLWRVTLILSQGQDSLCHYISLIELFLGTRYEVCESNSLRDINISSFFVTFDLHLWPSSSVKVTFTLIIRWTSCHNDVIIC